MSCHIISFSVFAGESANQLIHSFHFISKQQQQFTFLHCLLLTYLCTTGFWFVFPVNCVCVQRAGIFLTLCISLHALLCLRLLGFSSSQMFFNWRKIHYEHVVGAAFVSTSCLFLLSFHVYPSLCSFYGGILLFLMFF